jgi:predicted dehydrogenase
MSPSPNRRTFLGASLTAAAVAPRAVAAAADKLVVGVMGAGWRGGELSPIFAGLPNCEVAYVCDVDPARAGKVADDVAKVAKARPQAIGDFRKMIDDKAVDVFVCAAPNHWHVAASLLALHAGKHVYVEKPCAHNPREGEMLVAAAAKSGKRVQMGNQRRSNPNVIAGIEALKGGAIGRVYFAQAWYNNNRVPTGTGEAKDPPAGLDYELWQGPAPRKPFKSNYLHYTWHWFWHWGNGELGNNGVHTVDVCRWGLGVEYPTLVTSVGGRFRFPDDQETPDTNIASFKFADGKALTWEGFQCTQSPGTRAAEVVFLGENGTLAVDERGYTVFDPKGKELKKESVPAAATLHMANFLAGVRGEAKLNSEIAEGHKSTLLTQLGNISYRTGRTLHCDPTDGKVKNDPDAMKLWSREYAPGWEPKG